MIWVEAVRAYLHWVPVTKVQFEYFLCDRPNSRFDQTTYDTLLSLNERCSPREVQAKDYWRAFLTGIKPDEAQLFADWCRDESKDTSVVDFILPTREKWFEAYTALKAMPPIPLEEELKGLPLKPRAKTILERLETAATPQRQDASRTLADQMLLRLGVMEWVRCEDKQRPWGAYGQPSRKFCSQLYNLDAGKPQFVPNVDKRMGAYGFRLWRPG
jgi:hypothetical protein